MIDTAIRDLTPLIGTRAACVATGRPSASYYRGRTKPAPPHNKSPPAAAPAAAPSLAPASDSAQPRALTCAEREQVLAVLNSERFVDMAPASVYATLLDEGSYLCSESTMYRLLREHGLTGERRRHAATCVDDSEHEGHHS